MNFELDFIPKRTLPPRDSGLNMVMDKGLSLQEAQQMVDRSSELIDLVKLGFGTAYVTKNLQEKINLYKKHNIKVYLGGTLFEAFYARNSVDSYLKSLDKLGLEVLEISDGSVVIPHEEKCELIKKCSNNFTVLSEVGSKEEGILISPSKWISMMKMELEAGSWKVIAEARESGNVGIYRPNGSAHTMLINRILDNVAMEDILWEAPQKSQQIWFIKLLGANVNLGNIAPHEVIPLECLRLGLRGDTFFENLPSEIVSVMKQ